MTGQIEVTTQRVTTVDTIPEAFAFIMEWLDRVGPEPRIEISPFTDMPGGIMSALAGDDDADLFPTRFEVKIVYMAFEERKVEADDPR
jgi:hypothetical protein